VGSRQQLHSAFCFLPSAFCFLFRSGTCACDLVIAGSKPNHETLMLGCQPDNIRDHDGQAERGFEVLKD